jgi:cyclic pyranopterin phosphate synthase
MDASKRLTDSFGRAMGDLRISVTDRCNFHCLYCLPETEAAADFYMKQASKGASQDESVPIPRQWKPKSQILNYEEIVRIVRILAPYGLSKIRLTGGEPMLRRNLDQLIAGLSAIEGVRDLAMTSNGFRFLENAQSLKQAGLKRMTFSLDSLDSKRFKKMTGVAALDSVLDSIAIAKDLGFDPIRINAVVIRGMNDHEISDLAAFAQKQKVSMRFIEFMPLDAGRSWQKSLVVTGEEIMDHLHSRFDLVPVAAINDSETATRWRFRETPEAEIGIIASVSKPFCRFCNRLRLTADGHIRTCLFSLEEYDLKPLLRGGADDMQILKFIRDAVLLKEERHHIGESSFVQPVRTMSGIGG